MSERKGSSHGDVFYLSNLPAVGRGATRTLTEIWCVPTEHKYQAESLVCRFFKVTVKALVLSSLMDTEASS